MVSPETGHRLLAATYDTLMRALEAGRLARLREWLVGGAEGDVLEIGAGTGANFPYYKRVKSVTAIEPDRYMRRRAEIKLHRLGLRNVTIRSGKAEALPFPDMSFDSVVCTLVLCSVSDPVKALAEIRRVLRPGGSYRFIEHVLSSGIAAGIQNTATPIWRRLAGGCHLNRRTESLIVDAGFVIEEIRRFEQPRLAPMIAGVARRPQVNAL